MGKHYLKDKRIRIYAEMEGGWDADGYPTSGGWKPIHPGSLWAYVRQLSAKEYWAAGLHSEQYQEERFFVINWRDDVKPSMLIQYKDQCYNIVRIDPFEDFKTDIKLYVKEAVGGEVPDEGQVLPYE